MGVVIPFKTEGDTRQKLIDAVGANKRLKALITTLTDEEVQKAYDNTQGSLMKIVDAMIAMDKLFAEFMAKITEQSGNMFIVNSAINYIVEFSAKVPKHAAYVNELDNAYVSVFNAECHKVIEKAILSAKGE